MTKETKTTDRPKKTSVVKTPFKYTKSTKIKDLKEPPKNNKLISHFFKPVGRTALEAEPTEENKIAQSNHKDKGINTTSLGKSDADKQDVAKRFVKVCEKPGTSGLKLMYNRSQDDKDQSRLSEYYDKKKKFIFSNNPSLSQKVLDDYPDMDSSVSWTTATSQTLNFEENPDEAQKPTKQIQSEPEQFVPARGNSCLIIEKEHFNLDEKSYLIPNTIPTDQTESRLKKPTCPKYNLISGTTFAVDAFWFGLINNVTHYFLTHFHPKQYIGLKETFNRPIILSSITAACVKRIVKLNPKYLIELNPNETLTINGIKITAIDANQ